MSKLRQHDLSVVSSFNDLAVDRPEVVGSAIEKLVRFMREDMSIRIVVICEVIHERVIHERQLLMNVSLCLTSIQEYYPLFPRFFAGNILVFTTLLDILTYLMGFMLIPLVSISCIVITEVPC